jgi:hypothetical protein
MQDYQPVATRQPNRKELGERLMGLGEYDQALKFMTEEGKKQKPNVVAWGYGQMRDLDTGEVFAVPTPPPSSGMNGGGTPYFTPVQTADGIFSFNARTGKMEKVDVNGVPIVGSTSDPDLQGAIASAKESGKISGGTETHAQIDLPKIKQEAKYTSGLVEELIKHPGRSMATGKTSMLHTQDVPGTTQKAFMVRLNQIKGKRFLQAFESLKGAGQITEIEGTKATEAISRMDNSNSDEEFVTAAREFQGIIKELEKRAEERAGRKTQKPTSTGIKFLGFE